MTDHRCTGDPATCVVCEQRLDAREEHRTGRDRGRDYDPGIDWNWPPGMPY